MNSYDEKCAYIKQAVLYKVSHETKRSMWTPRSAITFIPPHADLLYDCHDQNSCPPYSKTIYKETHLLERLNTVRNTHLSAQYKK